MLEDHFSFVDNNSLISTSSSGSTDLKGTGLDVQGCVCRQYHAVSACGWQEELRPTERSVHEYRLFNRVCNDIRIGAIVSNFLQINTEKVWKVCRGLV